MTSKVSFALGILILLGIYSSCKQQSISAEFRKAVQAADSILVYQVEQYPVDLREQSQDWHYLGDYQIQEEQPITRAQEKDLRAALLDQSTFDSVIVKSCPMVAKSAIAIRKEGKTTYSLVISPAPCGKVLVFRKNQGNKVKSFDLSIGNKLEVVLAH